MKTASEFRDVRDSGLEFMEFRVQGSGLMVCAVGFSIRKGLGPLSIELQLVLVK